ncbi:proteinase-activated receptor 1-like [Elgaria multicarinata webbii]|uniref:proteinase-activated receptor 1-like n=1 Tax=Elgaria multicarinata webbii TaxID=159646 RepID=UPI002FCCE004
MAILMFVIKTKRKKPGVIYMLNLASADVVHAGVLPFKIFYFSRRNWAFGPGMCHFATTTFFCNMYCSILLLTAISIDRFLAVVYPMQSLSWRTLRRASVVCVAVWLIAIAGVIPLFTIELMHHIPQLNITTCFDVPAFSLYMKRFHYYLLILHIFFFFVPLLISTSCYVCIIRKLSSFNGAAQPGKKRRSILLSAAVLCSFIVCFGPTCILSLVQGVWPTQQWENLYVAHVLCLCIGTINCCIDPLIFYYASSECQKQVWNLLCQRKHSVLVKDLWITSSNRSARGLDHSSQA